MLWNLNFIFAFVRSASWPCPEPNQFRSSAPPQKRFFKIHSNILPSTAWSSKWSFPSVFPLKSCVHLSSPPSCHMLRPSTSYRFDQPDNSLWGVQVMKHLTVQSFPVPCRLVPYRPERLPHHPVLEHCVYVLPSAWKSKFQTVRKNWSKCSSVRFNPHISKANCKTKDSGPNGSRHSQSPVCS